MPASKEVEKAPLLDDAANVTTCNHADAPLPSANVRQPTTDQPVIHQPVIQPGRRAYISTFILFMINLLNYTDRYTIAANLEDIQKTYNITDNNGEAGLVQTVFIIGYLVTSPIFGYLGDRYSRKIIMSVGILFWSGATLSGSFVPKNMFWLFVLIRGLVGVGEASYTTISCTIIGDLFVGNRRTQMLMLFYFAIPVGSGFGYIAGKGIADAFHTWRWALRITPAFGVLSVICVMLIIKEPGRGQAETGNRIISSQRYIDDLKALLKNKTFVLTTLAFTTIAWVVGGLGLWMVKLMEKAYKINGQKSTSVSFIFGGLTAAAGFAGVTIGTIGAQWYRRYNPRADTLVCALGNLLAAPFLYIGLTFGIQNEIIAWICVFLGETCLFLNWALVPDILMQVLIPVRRSTGNGLQMLSGHLLGDALSPYILGAVSDAIRGNNKSDEADYAGLSYSLYLGVFFSVIGGGFFLASSFFVEQDKELMQKTLRHCQEVETTSDLPEVGSGVHITNDDVVI